MFAWECQHRRRSHSLGPAHGKPIRIWCGDIELHINADIACAIWHYRQLGMMSGCNERESRLSWKRLLGQVEWNAKRNCYEIRDVIGPDENHEHVNNNAFTNRMVQWHLFGSFSIDWLRNSHPERAAELERQLDLTTRSSIGLISSATCLCPPQTGLIEQFRLLWSGRHKLS